MKINVDKDYFEELGDILQKYDPTGEQYPTLHQHYNGLSITKRMQGVSESIKGNSKKWSEDPGPQTTENLKQIVQGET